MNERRMGCPKWRNIRNKFRENGLNHSEFESGKSADDIFISQVYFLQLRVDYNPKPY
jgi:hypothetical protein